MSASCLFSFIYLRIHTFLIPRCQRVGLDLRAKDVGRKLKSTQITNAFLGCCINEVVFVYSEKALSFYYFYYYYFFTFVLLLGGACRRQQKN